MIDGEEGLVRGVGGRVCVCGRRGARRLEGLGDMGCAVREDGDLCAVAVVGLRGRGICGGVRVVGGRGRWPGVGVCVGVLCCGLGRRRVLRCGRCRLRWGVGLIVVSAIARW